MKMCPNCDRVTKQISVSKGWCASCMKAYKEGVKFGTQEGYSSGYDEGFHDGDH